jgi:hypothetical protein
MVRSVGYTTSVPLTGAAIWQVRARVARRSCVVHAGLAFLLAAMVPNAFSARLYVNVSNTAPVSPYTNS